MHGIDSNSTSVSAFASNRAVFEIRPERHQEPDKSKRSEHKGDFERSARGVSRGVQIFRQEFMLKLKQEYSVITVSGGGGPDTYRRNESVKDVAAGVLTAARTITEKNIDEAPGTITALRRSLGQASSASQKFVETDDEAAAVKETVRLVESGLDELEEKAASGSIREISLESTVKQRSRIQIRTQEGDIVTLKFRRVDKISLSDESVVTDSNSASMTELLVSSRSRLSIMVKGDLNDAEQEAIRTVFAAAERLADEFFSGDMGAALEIAAGLEFDAEQLARVSMRFRSEERITMSQSVRQFGAAEVHDDDDGPQPVVTVTDANAQPRVGTVPVIEPVAPAVADTNVVGTETPQGSALTMPEVTAGFDAMLKFLGMLADYLEQAAGVSGNRPVDDAHPPEMRFEIGQSFKLEILRAVMSVTAPEESDPAADLPGGLIEQLDVTTDASLGKQAS